MRAHVWVTAVALAVTGCAQLAPLHPAAAFPTTRSEATLQSPTARRIGVTPTASSASTELGSGHGSAPPAPPEPLSPFDDSPVIFTVAGQHFTRGERVIVTVCLGPNHSIASADIFESSGDSKFDQLAVMWARRIRLREAAQGVPLASCGAVRVEVRPAQEPRMFHAPADSLS